MPTAIKNNQFPAEFESLLKEEFEIVYKENVFAYVYDEYLYKEVSDSQMMGACLQILHDNVNFMITSDPKTKKVTVYCPKIGKTLKYESMYQAVINLCKLIWMQV